jgi:hypothetical protein
MSENQSAGTAAARIAREMAEVTDDEIRAAAREAEQGYYSEPRECPCGDAHLSRAVYWDHRLTMGNV